MAGTPVGQGAQILGNALIPETMARMRMPGLVEQAERKQQVGNIQAGRLLGGMNAEIGTPQTKAYQVNGQTYGQDRASTVSPLFSPTKKIGLFSQVPQATAETTGLKDQIFPQGFSGTLGKDETAFVNGKPVASGPRSAPEAAHKEGDVKDFIIGSQMVPHTYTGGKWVKMEGMGGPRWEAPRAPQKPYGWDEEQADKKAKAAREAAEAERKARADEYAFQSTDAGFTDIMRKAAKLGTNPDLEEYTGSYDARTPNLTPGAKQFDSELSVLKSNLAMNAINAAKAASATGATGFGALSAPELDILMNQIATLDPAVGKENFQKQVVEIINTTKGMRNRLRATRPANAPAPSTASALPGFTIERMDQP